MKWIRTRTTLTKATASHIFHDLGGTDLTARIVKANTRGTKTSKDPRLERFQFVNATTPPEIEKRKLRMRAGLSLWKTARPNKKEVQPERCDVRIRPQYFVWEKRNPG